MKYKVWDSLEKRWMGDNGSFYMGMNGKLCLYLDCMEKAGDIYMPVYSTGKTDKNGIEIYKKDIIKINLLRGIKNGVQIREDKRFIVGEMSETLFLNRHRECEVIGNKYEGSSE